jgi:electron transfer flavoprotein alpha subunit
MSEFQGIWIVADRTPDGHLDEAVEELFTPARELAERFNERVTAVLLGDDDASALAAARLGHLGADRVIFIKEARLASYQLDIVLAALAPVLQEGKPRLCLFSSSTHSTDFAPRLAVRIGAALTTQAIGIEVNEAGKTLVTRSCYAESMLSAVTAAADTAYLITVKKKAFAKAKADESRTAPVEIITPELSGLTPHLAFVQVQASESKGAQNLDDADIVVSGGRGLKEPGNFKLVEELAAAIGAAVGASRAVVDAGWRPHSEQVGQTGKTVSPKLYFALGISGALQHQVGMNASQIIIAINRDEQAPIFKLADFGIIGDVTTIAPELTRTIQERHLTFHP